MIGPRYQKRQEVDRSWSIIDSTIDDSRREHLIMMGLSRKQARMIRGTLNKSQVALNDAERHQWDDNSQASYG